MKSVISGRLLSSKEAQPREKPFEIRDTRLRGFLLRVQPSGVRVYYVQLSRIKRERIGDAGALTPDEARDRCAIMLGNFASGRDVRIGLPNYQTDASKEKTFGDYIAESYEPYQRGNFKTAAGTIKRIKQLFGEWYPLQLRAITPKLIDEWKSSRRDKVTPSTLMRDMQTLSGVLQHAMQVGEIIDANPLRKVRKPKLDRSPKVRFLDADEEDRLRDALSARDLARRAARDRGNLHTIWRGKPARRALLHFGDHLTPAVLLKMNTGLRRGELRQLRWEDIDLTGDEPNLTVVGQRDKGGGSKSSQTRHIPLNDDALDALKKWREQCEQTAELVFPHISTARTAWEAVLKKAGIKRFRFHDLRHHFASRLAQASVALFTICTLMGHSDIKTTLLYAHLSPHEGRDAVNRISGPRVRRVSRLADCAQSL